MVATPETPADGAAGIRHQLTFPADAETRDPGTGPVQGFFVSIEGGDGAGKTTQLDLLERRLRERGLPVVVVQEPGTTGLGNHVRTWVKRERAWAKRERLTVPIAEAFLFEAARAQLVETVIVPALRQGNVVLSDRFSDSTLAYQGYGRKLALRSIATLNRLATGGLKPDLTVLLDLDPNEGLKRVQTQRRLGSVAADQGTRLDRHDERRFEQASAQFHRRVLEGFRRLAAREPERWVVIDANRPPEEIAAEVWDEVASRLRRYRRTQREARLETRDG